MRREKVQAQGFPDRVGIGRYRIDVNGRRVEVYTAPGPAGYGSTEVFAEGQSVPVVIDGRAVGRIAVADILPPRRPRAQAEGNGA